MAALHKRSFLKMITAQGITMGLTSSGLWLPRLAHAQSPGLKWANLAPGFTILVTEYMQAKGIDKKYGLNLGKPTTYSSVSTYYNDFVAGNYDVCIGSWDTFAARYLAGVPIQFVCAISTASMINIVVPKNGVASIKQLEGKILAAPQSTGTYRMTRAIIKELAGIDLETATKVQNVDNPAASISLVMADRADAGLSWEPNISAGIKKVPDMRVLYNAGYEYKKKLGLELPYFGVAIRKEAIAKDPSLAGKVDRAFADALAGITADVENAVKVAGARSGIPPDIIKLAISSGRLQFKHMSMAEEKGREALRTASAFLVRTEMLARPLDNNFFIS